MANFRNTRWFSLVLFFTFLAAWIGMRAVVGYVFFDWLKLVKDSAEWTPSLMTWIESLSFLAALIATAVVQLVGKKRIGELGYASNGALRQFVIGSIYGIVAPTILVLAIALLGGFDFGSVAMHGSQLAKYAIGWLIAMLGIGLAEESLFRATPQFTLAGAIGTWPAAIVISLIFGALHFFGKPGETLADGFSVTLLGIFMAFTVVRSGSIWFAAGFHTFFDYCALYVYGAPNSGNKGGQPLATKLLTGTYHGPMWLTGGPLGVEASWLVFPLIALLFLVYHFTTRPRTA